MKWLELYKKYGTYIFLVVLFAVFSVIAPNFLSFNNAINILRQVSIFGIVVTGVSMIMIGGGMDLSVGAQLAVDGMILGVMMHDMALPIPVAVGITICVGVLLGSLNGLVAVKLNIMPIIVTLSTMLMLQGIAYIITGGYPITGMPEAFKWIGQGYIFGVIPVPIVVFAIFVVVGWLVMNRTYIGRYLYALGGNKEAARLAGIDVNKATIGMYAFCGFAASIASLILVGRTNASQPGAGSTYAFDCMTAACLGGISMRGGEGKISGTIVGVLVLGILDNGLVLLGVNSNMQSVVKGAILLIVVALDSIQIAPKKLDVATIEGPKTEV